MMLSEFRPTRSTEPLSLAVPQRAHGVSRLSRTDLGLPEDSFVVALCVDPPSAGDARRFMYFIALLEALQRPVVGLLPSASWNIERATRWVRTTGPRWQFRVIDAPLDACWEAVDLGVMMAAPWVLDHDMDTLRTRLAAMVASAHAAGTPVIWSGDHQPAAHYPSEIAELLKCESDVPRRIAYKAAALLDDADRYSEVRDALRAHAAPVDGQP